MTKDEIIAMQPGRELDALVAEKVMGWNYTPKKVLEIYEWQPSTDISAAWEVVEKTRQLGWMLYKIAHTLSCTGKIDGFICIYLHIESGASREVISDTASEAISKAALLAVME